MRTPNALRSTSVRIGIGALAVLLILALVLVVHLQRSRLAAAAAAQTPNLIKVATEGGESTDVQHRGKKAHPDAYAFRSQYFITLDLVSTDLSTRLEQAGYRSSCTAGLKGLPAEDIRTQMWQILPTQTCLISSEKGTFGYIWLVEQSSGSSHDSGAYIDMQGEFDATVG